MLNGNIKWIFVCKKEKEMSALIDTVYLKKISILKLLLMSAAIVFLSISCMFPADDPVDAGGMSIMTVTVPLITNFPMGYTGVAEPVHIIPLISSFKIGKYEVTYNEWYNIKKWSSFHGYQIIEFGREGNNGTIGAAPTITKNEPVLQINWRDSIVWCNAASEYFGLKPVYYTDSKFINILKISIIDITIDTAAGSIDNPYINWTANGYRLPTEAEWEAAARYNDGLLWTPGNYASGAAAYDVDATGAVAWYHYNSGSLTHDVGTKNANQLAIYDMSGNISEWCWDWYGLYTTLSPYTDPNPKGPDSFSGRIIRSGSWAHYHEGMAASARETGAPFISFIYTGFRVARSL
jgi:formylglycine-generating enzyme